MSDIAFRNLTSLAAPMDNTNPIDLIFGGMEKLGPGNNADTLHVLSLLPRQQFQLVVDAGCGTGRQTLALATELGTRVHAVDSYEPFLSNLAQRAKEHHIEQLVQTHCMDMKDIRQAFQDIDLLWCEGAAYNIGFANALASWLPALAADGFVVVSELVWLKERAPDTVKEYFRTGYPEMQSLQHNRTAAERIGYKVLATHTLPRSAWVNGYYELLSPRAKTLLDHANPAVQAFAAETVREIEVFEVSEDSYGYVFYVLQCA
jgi:cyclopropane fatty-acyl-phospholipid synthase-like methyltransferase